MSAGIVIVGAGQAACQAVVSLRQMGYTGALTMVGEERHLPYQRPPLSKDFLTGESASEAVRLRPLTFYDAVKCDMRMGVKVASIDRRRRLLHLDGGDTLPYERLVLATGARARPYPNAQIAGDRLHYLRTLDDANKLREALAGSRSLAILGAGYIGMEVAASASQRGIRVTVYEAAPRVMQRSVGQPTSAAVQALHARSGVLLKLNTMIESLSVEGESAREVALCMRSSGGESLAFDNLVVGIGADANLELAEVAGIECGRGIRVDENCRTSDEAIFAIGDCAEQHHSLYGAGMRLESVQNAVDQAKRAAAALAGRPTPPVNVPWFWSDQFGHRIQVAGVPQSHDRIVVRKMAAADAQAMSQSVWYLRDDKVTSVETIDAPADFMTGKALIQNAGKVEAGRLADSSFPLQAFLNPPGLQARGP